VPAQAYDGPLHQQFTFIAARHLNDCLDGTSLPRLAPLEVRYIALANVAEVEGGWFGWMFRSDFYDRARQAEKSWMWVLDTRIHERYRESIERLEEADELDRHAASDRYAALGRVVATIEDMTSPAHVVPVYFARWWRLNLSDRFDGFPIDAEAVEASLKGDCEDLLAAEEQSLEELLVASASDTLRAVQRPIEGLPTSWQAFWTLAADPEAFGEYGPAGNNFGKHTEFDCKDTRCVLLDRDPLYRAFALERHRVAVVATARAMLWLQRRVHAAAPVFVTEE
jgi:hypothetical protein